eukprot:gnl/MRDRNA2_/MRDRNA2_50290_c0_seq1.p1 gnl/MRDRNA2_/MRDRNA2_50290_c0~~gnl/MRDRNA2_/MRDRNA2_50290_c0_seq1.p1  ORF type:complete len:711 (+),score=135.33 gnl/MRDRNA2_/MRDRNA2_50290_c0_seq1:153-2285(+)
MRKLLVSLLLILNYGFGFAQSSEQNLVGKLEDTGLSLLLQEALEASIVIKNGTVWKSDKEPLGAYYIIGHNETVEDYQPVEDHDEAAILDESHGNPLHHLKMNLDHLSNLSSKLDLIETHVHKKSKAHKSSRKLYKNERSSRRRRRRSSSGLSADQTKALQDGVKEVRAEIAAIRDIVKTKTEEIVEVIGGGDASPNPSPSPSPSPKPNPKPSPKPSPSGKATGQKFSYMRFITLKTRGKNEMQISGIKFRENGQDVKIVKATGGHRSPHHEGPSKAIDGNCRTKFLDHGWKQDGKKYALVLQLDGKRAVDEMMLVTANDVNGRDPMQFVVEGSNDKHTWTQIYKSKSNENIPTRRFADTEWIELVPLDKVIENREKEQKKEVKQEEKEREELVKKKDPTPSPPPGPIPDPAKGPKYKFVRFSPIATRSDGIMQVAELKPKCIASGKFLKVINAESGGDEHPPNEGPKHCIDGNVGTKWLAQNKGLKGIVLELEHPGHVTGIEIVTGNDVPGRDPIMFKVEGSHENTNDQSKWKLLYKSTFKEQFPVGRGQSITIEFKEPKKCSSNGDCDSGECSDGQCKPAKPKVFCAGKEGWSSGNNGKCYKFIPHEPARVKFDTARKACQDAGGDLDTFDNERDGTVHYDKCREGKQENGYTHYRTCWLGYSDRKQEGKIVSELDGSPRKWVGRYMDWNNWNKPDRDCPVLNRQKMG